MIRSRQRFAFAKRGAAVMLAATLTAGMVPTMALAQADGSGGATASAAATNDGFYLEEGRTYTVPVSWLNASTGAESMAASYLSKTATVSYRDGGYDIRVSANDKGMSELLGMTYGGTAAVSTGAGEFQILSSTLTGSIGVSLTIKTMQDMGMGAVGVNLSLTRPACRRSRRRSTPTLSQRPTLNRLPIPIPNRRPSPLPIRTPAPNPTRATSQRSARPTPCPSRSQTQAASPPWPET